MDLLDQLRTLSTRIESNRALIQTEEATKNSMIMPFIQALGYNVFDPTEVTPELTADVGTKKGEKVDYAILKDGKPVLIFECKSCNSDLNINHASQLFRYFHVTETRFAILTNGITYKFFTDLDQPNKMDERPFLEFNVISFKDSEVEELKKFSKFAFNVESILATASDLKYTRAIRHIISDLMLNPTDDFVKLIASDFLQGKRFTPAIKEQFSELTKRAFQQLISSKLNEILNNAMRPDSEVIAGLPAIQQEEPSEEASANGSEIVTTEEELEGFHIVKSILREIVQHKRIAMRDAQSYCAILLDDNNRKPICRLRFNNTSRSVLGLFDGKTEERFPISEVDEIHNYADRLKQIVSSYDAEKQQSLQQQG